MAGPAASLRLLHSEQAAWGPGRPMAASPAVALAPEDLRILIVNEDMHSANSLKRTLHELGYCTTLTAYSASRALVAADDFSPALAVLDLELPDMSGFQLAKKLRTHSRSHVRQVPLIAVAERHLFGTLELTQAAGFIGCLTKPVLPMALHDLLRKLQR
jgi:CheY-like chemotaxis protein